MTDTEMVEGTESVGYSAKIKALAEGMTRERFADLYSIIANGLLGDDFDSTLKRSMAVRDLGLKLRTEFKDTDDFHIKCRSYLNDVPDNEKLRVKRETLGHNQTKMAAILGVSRPFYAQMEAGVKPLNKNTLRFIHEITIQPYTEDEKATPKSLITKER